jgi:hypothetical protein
VSAPGDDDRPDYHGQPTEQEDKAEVDELLRRVDEALPLELRSDWLRMRAGGFVVLAPNRPAVLAPQCVLTVVRRDVPCVVELAIPGKPALRCFASWHAVLLLK